MQINVALSKNNKNQAEMLRKVHYPNTNANQTRDAFIFNQCIDRFADDMQVLEVYLKRDAELETVQRMVTIKAESYERLQTISKLLHASLAATYRSIIAYSVDRIAGDGPELEKLTVDESSSILLQQIVKEKIVLLEAQLAECRQTMAEIKELLNSH